MNADYDLLYDIAKSARIRLTAVLTLALAIGANALSSAC